MATSTYAQIIQGIGHCVTEIDRIEAELRHLRGQLGELRMAARNWRDVPESGDRREQPVQGSVYQAIQGVEKTLKTIPAQNHSNRHTYATGHWGSLGTGWHFRPWVEDGDKPDQVQGQVHDAGSNEPPNKGGVQLEAETPSCGADTGKDF